MYPTDTFTGAASATAPPALATDNTTPLSPNAAATGWSNTDTRTDDTANTPAPADKPLISRCSCSKLSADPGTVTVTGNPPGDTDDATPARPSPNAAAEPEATGAVASPADGHTGTAGGDHGAHEGCAGAGRLTTGLDGTGSSAATPGEAAATGTGGKPHTKPATNDTTTPTATDLRGRRMAPPP